MSSGQTAPPVSPALAFQINNIAYKLLTPRVIVIPVTYIKDGTAISNQTKY